MKRKLFLPVISVLAVIPILYILNANNFQLNEYEKKIQQIDDNFTGSIGVYIKNLEDGTEVKYNSDRLWYLASTVKIPIAIAILQKVEKGDLSLDDEVTLNESDMVDGNGELIWQQPGTKYTVRELIERMIRDSDSIAADMLIRLIGEEEFNEHVKENIISEGIKDITTILQVRYDAYAELHENVSALSNFDIIKLKVTPQNERLNEFAKMISVDRKELKLNSISDAFEKYYERGLNSAEPEAMGLMLERLAKNEYLNKVNTDLLLAYMKGITTGERRIKAGLPIGTAFAQKTGTQVRRAANIGIIFPSNDNEPIIIAAFAEGFENLAEAETAMENIGKFITGTWLE